MNNKKIDNKQIVIFENFKIRRHYDKKSEVWYFSVVDIISALTESVNPTDYLKKLRKRDIELGKYIGTNCPQIEMLTETGKKIVSGENFLQSPKSRGKLKEGN